MKLYDCSYGMWFVVVLAADEDAALARAKEILAEEKQGGNYTPSKGEWEVGDASPYPDASVIGEIEFS